MINPPNTVEEARATKYGNGSTWCGRAHYYEGFCAWEVWSGPQGMSSKQCYRRFGHGPGGLYCKQHAKFFEEDSDD